MHACQHIHASLACAALCCVCVWVFDAHAFQVTTQLHAQGRAGTQFVSVQILFQLHIRCMSWAGCVNFRFASAFCFDHVTVYGYMHMMQRNASSLQPTHAHSTTCVAPARAYINS